jgi:hypothetical protein
VKNDFQQLEPDYYTCVPVPGFEKDPAVTKALREFDPELIPMWRIQLWRFPDGSQVRAVHHVIGRYFPVPRYMRRRFHVGMPMDARRKVPNFLDAVLEYDDTLQFRQGGPGDYVPWDWALYRWCRFQFDKTTVEAWERRHEVREQRIAKAQADHQAELAYRKKQIEPYLQRLADSLSDRDWKEYMAAVWENPGNPEIRRKPKTMIVVGGRSPRSTKHSERVAPAQGERNAAYQEVLE